MFQFKRICVCVCAYVCGEKAEINEENEEKIRKFISFVREKPAQK